MARSPAPKDATTTLNVRHVPRRTALEFKAQAARQGLDFGPYLARVTALVELLQREVTTAGAAGKAARRLLTAAGLLLPP